MPSNTIYNPQTVGEFEKSKLNFNGQKVSGICSAGETANLDLTLTDDCLMTGASVTLINRLPSDNIKLQIVHPTAGVLFQYIDWYAKDFDKEIPYPAKIPAGLILRLVYVSTGAQGVEIYLNYSLHKVLV